VAQFEDGRLETVSVPQRGEYVNSVTPLTVDNPLSHIRLHIEQTIVNRIAILTDGLQSLCINEATNIPYDPFFMPFFHAMDQILDTTEVSQQLTHFLASERICARTDDDKTLVVIGRIQQGLQGMFAAPSTHPSITRGTDAALHNRQ
jgi:hypothetical protein